MPTISRFYGISIRMFYNEHNPPHFHAIYGRARASFQIDSLQVLKGHLPPRAESFVVEWARMHADELMRDWEMARRDEVPLPIAPLE